MKRNISSFLNWLRSNPLKAGIGQFILAPLVYVIFQILYEPFQFLSNPLERTNELISLIILNIPVSLGVVIYIHSKKIKRSKE